LVSGRVQVTLYPTGYSAVVAQDEGDLPSWIVTIKGPTEWSLEVPFLSRLPWQYTQFSDYVEPVVVVRLLDTLPQPFDKPVSIFCAAFQGTGPDFQFAGLQSFVPPPVPTLQSTDEAHFQSSISASISMAERIGTTYEFPFQGGLMDVHDLLTRFSSRDPASFAGFPFPVKIASWGSAYALDNFDYVCNLYKFYTGETNVKILYSGAVQTGALIATVGSSLQGQSYGNFVKAGNSMVLTDQTVWPMLEFKYPFLNNVEFDSIWEPNGMFYQTILNAGDMQMYLISGSQNFHPFYLLPVPDFFLTSKPVPEEPEEAVFQSYSSLQRMFLPRTYWGSSVQEEADGTPQVIPLDTINYSQTFGFKVKFTVAYTNGPGSGYYARIGLGRDLPTDFGFGFEGPNMSSTLLGMTSGRLNNPTDNTNTSLELEFEGVSQQQTGFEPLKLFIVLINASPDTEKLLFNYVVELRSIGSITCLSSFQDKCRYAGCCRYFKLSWNIFIAPCGSHLYSTLHLRRTIPNPSLF